MALGQGSWDINLNEKLNQEAGTQILIRNQEAGTQILIRNQEAGRAI